MSFCVPPLCVYARAGCVCVCLLRPRSHAYAPPRTHIPQSHLLCGVLWWGAELSYCVALGVSRHHLLQLYQFSRLVHDELPLISEQFEEHGVEPFLYATPWFLSIFNSQFPQAFCNEVFDHFLLEGTPTHDHAHALARPHPRTSTPIPMCPGHSPSPPHPTPLPIPYTCSSCSSRG